MAQSIIDNTLDSYLNPELDGLYEAAGKRYNINPLWLKAQDQQESGQLGDAAAGDAEHVGRGQIGPALRKKYGIPDNPSSEQGIMGMAHIMSDLLQKHGGNMQAALTEYTGGEDQSKWGDKTAAYAPAVARNYAQLGGAPSIVSYHPLGNSIIDGELDSYIKSSVPGDPNAKLQSATQEPWTQGSTTANAFMGGAGVPLRAGAEALYQTAKEKLTNPAFAGQSFGSLLGANYDSTKRQIQDARAQYAGDHPTGDLVGNLIGGALPAAAAIATGNEYAVAPIARSLAAYGPKAETAVNMLTGAMGRDAPWLARAASRIAPGVTAGTTAALTQSGLSDKPLGQQLETGAEFGGLLGPAGGQLADTFGSQIAPRVAAQAQKLMDAGVNLQPSQIPGASWLYSLMKGNASGAAQRTGLTQATSQTFGENSPTIDNDLMAQAGKRIGGMFEQFKGATIDRDQDLHNDVMDTLARGYAEGGDENYRAGMKELAGVADDLIGDGKTPISGATFLNMTKSGSKLDQLTKDPMVGYHATQLTDALYGALERSVAKAGGRWVPAGPTTIPTAQGASGLLTGPKNLLLGTGSSGDIRLPQEADGSGVVPYSKGGTFQQPVGGTVENAPADRGMVWQIDPQTEGALKLLRDARGQYKNLALVRSVMNDSTGEIQPSKLAAKIARFYPPSALRTAGPWESQMQALAPASQFVPNAPTGAPAANNLSGALRHAGTTAGIAALVGEYGKDAMHAVATSPIESLAALAGAGSAYVGKKAAAKALDSPAVARMIVQATQRPDDYGATNLPNLLLAPPTIQLANQGNSSNGN